MKNLLAYLAVGGFISFISFAVGGFISSAIVSIGDHGASTRHCNERGGVPVRGSTGGTVCLAPGATLPPAPPAPLRSM